MAEEDASTGRPTDARAVGVSRREPRRGSREPAIITFEQVFLGPSDVGTGDRARGGRESDDPRSAGFDPTDARRKPTLLPRRMTQTSPADLVARDFGPTFAVGSGDRRRSANGPGRFDSAFGAHYVRVSERTPAVTPQLSDVRDAVVREWENERRQRARDDSYAKLRRGYDVSIEAKLPTERAMRRPMCLRRRRWLAALRASVPARADEFKPAYLQLTQLDGDTYDVLWKLPAIDESTTLKVKPRIPRRNRGTDARCAVPMRAASQCNAGACACRTDSMERPSSSRSFRKRGSTCSRDSCASTAPCSSSASCRCSPRFVVRPSPGRWKW